MYQQQLLPIDLIKRGGNAEGEGFFFVQSDAVDNRTDFLIAFKLALPTRLDFQTICDLHQ